MLEMRVAVSRFKGKSTCFIFVNVSFNESLKFAKEVKIRECDTFSKRKSRGVDTELVTVAH
jgi:hypothetical protein